MRLTHPSGDEPIDLDTVDLVDPVPHAQGDPHAIWLAMRTHDPVHWQQIRPDLGFWSATSHDDVERVLRDHTAFTSEHGTLLNLLGRQDPAGEPEHLHSNFIAGIKHLPLVAIRRQVSQR